MLKILLIISILVSCNEFSHKRLTNGPDKTTAPNPFQVLSGIDNETKINEGSFTKRKLIANAALNIAAPAFNDLGAKSVKLSSEIGKYCLLVEKASSWDSGIFETMRKGLQEDWKALMKTFHLIEGLQFGPQSEGFPDTEMTKIFPYGTTWDCGALGETVKMSNDPGYRFSAGYSPYGLSNLLPLLFSSKVDEYCPESRVKDPITAWRKKDRLGREKDVCNYAKKVSNESSERISRVAEQWSHQYGFLAKKIVDENYFGNPIETINKISDGLFYIEKELKDERLAVPAGISNCLSASCPYMSIHRLSGISIDSVIQNLNGFKMLFKGITFKNNIDGFGFDDYLDSQKKTFVRIQIEGAINTAITNFEKAKLKGESIESLSAKISDKKLCLDSTSENRIYEMCALYQDVRAVSVLLKNEFLLALGELSAPRQVQGDLD